MDGAIAFQTRSYTVTNSLFYASLAYRAAFLAAASLEIGDLTWKLSLGISRPVAAQHFTEVRISSPNFRDGFGGTVVVQDDFQFSFSAGKVHTIASHRFMSDTLLLEDYRRLAGQESQIRIEEAYALSLRHLRAIDFDVDGFHKIAATNVVQLKFGPEGIPLPMFEIALRATNSAANVEVGIDGSKEAAGHRLLNIFIHGNEAQQFLRRPLIVITNALELNAKPDPPTKKIGRR